MSDIERNKALVTRYFHAIDSSDFEAVADMMASDLRFWCAGGTGATESVVFASPEQLLTDLRHSLGDLYDANTGINTEVLSLTAEEDRVVAEVCIRGRSAHSGEPYENLYVFLFWIRDSVFREVHEHLDTAYAERVLLKPAGVESGADMPWLEDSGDTCD
jgi:ketosteroid isomerase-like protein